MYLAMSKTKFIYMALFFIILIGVGFAIKGFVKTELFRDYGRNLDKQQVKKTISQAESLSAFNLFTWLDTDSILSQIDELHQDKEINPHKDFPLWGITYVAKDNIDTNFMPTSGGTNALRDKTPSTTAPVIDKLRNAGAILLGKTNMHELAFGITSNNAAFGPVRNPYNYDYIAGGSSGGTAAAIAAGLVDVGLGTDTGGSMRIPAALNGVYGFRPTIGRYPEGGSILLSSSRDVIGVMANNMDMLIKFDSVLSGDETKPVVKLSTLRIGVPHEHFHENLDNDVRQELAKLIALLESKGVEIVYVDMKNVGAMNHISSFPIVLYETVQELPLYLASRGDNVDMDTLISKIASPDVKGILTAITGAGAISEKDYQHALTNTRPALLKAYEAYFSNNRLDAMLVMTTPSPASLIGEDTTFKLNGEDVPTFPTFIRNTDPASNASLVALSMPVGLSSKGLPIGAELVGLMNSDRFLLQLAAELEKFLPKLPAPALACCK